MVLVEGYIVLAWGHCDTCSQFQGSVSTYNVLIYIRRNIIHSFVDVCVCVCVRACVCVRVRV